MKIWKVPALALLSFGLVLALVFREGLFHPLTLVLSTWEGDIPSGIFPIENFGVQEMAKGHFPLWNPRLFGGVPYLGNVFSPICYPFNLPFYFFPMPLAFNFVFLLHELFAGIFMAAWAWSRGLKPISCWWAGFLFAFCGATYFRIFAGHLTLFCTVVWVPLVFMGVEKTLEKGKPLWVLLGVGAVSMQVFAGHLQIFIYTAAMAGLYAGVLLWKNPFWKRGLALLCLMGMGALFLTAAQWAAVIQVSRECTRGAKLSYDFAGSFSLPPEGLIKILLPDLFEKFGSYKYGRPGNFWETTPYFGIMGLIMAVYAVAVAPFRIWRAPLLVGGAAILLALGAYTPWFPFFYHFVPGVSHLRASARFLFIFCAFASLLAGSGLDLLFNRTRNKRRRDSVFLGWMGIFLALLGALSFVSSPKNFIDLAAPILHFQVGVLWTLEEQFWIAKDFFLAAAVFLGSALLFRLVKDSRRLGSCLVLIGLIETVSFTNTHSALFEWKEVQQRQNRAANFFADHPGDYRVQGDFETQVETAGGTNILGYYTFIPRRFSRLIAEVQGLGEEDVLAGHFKPVENFPARPNLFRLLRCRYLLGEKGGQLRATELPGEILPAFFLVGRWEKGGSPEEIFTKLLDPRFPLNRKVILEEPPDPLPLLGDPQGKVHVVERSTDEREIQADLKDAGLLVFSENYTEGWEAVAMAGSVQNQYKVIPADYILQAIPLTPGKHHFLLRYHPAIFIMGIGVSLVSFAIYLFVVFFFFLKGVYRKGKG